MNRDILNKLFPKMMELRDSGRCPFCGDLIDIDTFKDPKDKKEFEISGLCLKCQRGQFHS